MKKRKMEPRREEKRKKRKRKKKKLKTNRENSFSSEILDFPSSSSSFRSLSPPRFITSRGNSNHLVHCHPLQNSQQERNLHLPTTLQGLRESN
jgi:hypothetical protein